MLNITAKLECVGWNEEKYAYEYEAKLMVGLVVFHTLKTKVISTRKITTDDTPYILAELLGKFMEETNA